MGDFTARIGSIFAAVGNRVDLRAGRNGELIVASGRGKYAEAVERGQVYVASNAVAGVDPGTALSTTPPLLLWNQAGSGVNLSILRVTIDYLSGTLGAGFLAHIKNTQATAPTTGTAITPQPALLGVTTGKALAYTGSTISATATLIRGSGISWGAGLASTAGFFALGAEDVDGSIMVPEGQAYGLQGICAAGSTPRVLLSITYQEIPTA